jgi:hypothetical protein
MHLLGLLHYCIASSLCMEIVCKQNDCIIICKQQSNIMRQYGAYIEDLTSDKKPIVTQNIVCKLLLPIAKFIIAW